MKVGLISDTHNNTINLLLALNSMENAGVKTLFYLGDATTPDTVEHLYNFHTIYVFGNGDQLTGAIREALILQNPNNFAGLTYTGQLNEIPVAAAHGHIPNSIEKFVSSGQFSYVFHGHTHRRRDETIGSCRVINPGALGGLKKEERSFAILEPTSGDLEFILLD